MTAARYNDDTPDIQGTLDPAKGTTLPEHRVIYSRYRHFDPLVVEALVQRYPVPSAAPADRAAAAKQLHSRGHTAEQIGVWLGCGARHVERMVREQVVEPLPEPIAIPDGEYPSCRHGHELSPDNVYMRQKFGGAWRECLTCRRAQQRVKNHKHRKKVGLDGRLAK